MMQQWCKSEAMQSPRCLMSLSQLPLHHSSDSRTLSEPHGIYVESANDPNARVGAARSGVNLRGDGYRR